MKIKFLIYISIIILSNIIGSNTSNGQTTRNAFISGIISTDSSWNPIVYLSHIPTYDNMYQMSNEMIIAKTDIDSLGYFEFNIDFLPCDDNLYRLHVTKKGDSPATLIIGGKEENHLFLIMNCSSKIFITTAFSNTPFKGAAFMNSEVNSAFQQISNMVFKSDSLASESSAAKRALIEERLNESLLNIADTSHNFLVSLYAIYKSKFESNYNLNSEFYTSYLKKWRKQDNDYFKSFKKQLPKNVLSNTILFVGLIITASIISTVYLIGKYRFRINSGFQKLSVQERKVFELLRQGATNQEISTRCNIGVSTVKSHVSSIYSKLNIKSRKDILNLKL